jgi:hypothetical protein
MAQWTNAPTLVVALSLLFACSERRSGSGVASGRPRDTQSGAATPTPTGHPTDCPGGASGDVRVIDGNECLVRRRLFDGKATCPPGFAFAPDEPGSPGPQFIDLRPDSLLARCGVRNGDRWISVNGVPFKPDTALQAYATLRAADRAVMKLLRGGQEVTMTVVHRE